MVKFKRWMAVALSLSMILTGVPAKVNAAGKPTLKENKTVVWVNGAVKKIATKNSKGYKVTYASGNSKIASVSSSGKIIGKKKGKTVITVTFKKKGFTIKKKLNVTVKTGISKITMANKEKILKMSKIGSYIRIKTEVLPKTNQDTVQYKTSDAEVITVSEDGVIKAVGYGKATVTAKASGSGKSAKVAIEIQDTTLTAEQTGAKIITLTSKIPFMQVTEEEKELNYDLVEPDTEETSAEETKEVTEVETTKELPVSVKIGNSEVKATCTVSDDSKTATVKLSTAIRAAKYTIEIAGRTTEVQGEREEAQGLRIVGDKAYIADMDGAKANKVLVEYGLFNQFDERMSKSLNVNAISSMGEMTIDTKRNRLIHNVTQNILYVGSKVQAMVYTEDGMRDSKDLTLVAQPIIKELEYKGIYSPEGKDLTEEYKGNDIYYLMVQAKDQYGNDMNDISDTDFQKQAIEALSVNFVGGQTNLDLASSTPETQEIDGENYLTWKLSLASGKSQAQAGDATFNIYSTTGGATLTQTIPVAYGNTVDTFKVTGPTDGIVVAGEEIEFDYTALDKYGKPVTSIRELKKVLVNSDLLAEFEFKKEEGRVKLLRKENSDKALGYRHVVFRTNTNQYSQLEYTVMAEARLTSIAGYTGDTGCLSSQSETPKSGQIEFNTNYFQFADQYGRIMDNIDVYENDEFVSSYRITLTDDSKKLVTYSGSSLLELKYNKTMNLQPTFVNRSRKITFQLSDASGLEIKDEVYDDNKSNSRFDYLTRNFTEDSQCDVLIRSVNPKNIKSYEVLDIYDLYIKAKEENSYYVSDVVVNAVMSDGYKFRVTMSAGEYTINLPWETDIAPDDANGRVWLKTDQTGELYLDSGITEKDFVVDGKEVNEFTREVEIIPNNNVDERVTKTVVISRKAPEVTSACLREISTAASALPVGDLIKSMEISVKQLTSGDLDFIDNIQYTDQYGASNTSTTKTTSIETSEIEERIKYYVRDIDSDNGYVKNNGTSSVSYSRFQAGDTFILEIEIDKATITLPVILTN